MDIFKLKEDGYSNTAIAKMLDIDRKTVWKYLKRGKNNPPVQQTRQRTSILDPFKDRITVLLAQGEKNEEYVSSVVIARDLKKQGYPGSVSLIRKYLQKTRGTPGRKLVPIIPTCPGKEAQVDWGEKMLPDKKRSKHKVYFLTMTLSHSGTRFVYFTPQANRYHFLLAHKKAFEYFGGVPETLLYDQTRCAIDKPGFGQVQWNREFYEFARHYGFYPKACNPGHPQRKGRVENTVKYVKRNFLPLVTFSSFPELNESAVFWMREVNNQIHSTTEKVPLEVLREEELSIMNKLPARAYDLAEIDYRTVQNTSTISYRGKKYSVSPDLLGKTVTVKYKPEQDAFHVFYLDRFICRHRISRKPGKIVMLKEHQKEVASLIRQRFHVVGKSALNDSDPSIKRSLTEYEWEAE